uniref:Uncharacterized protein n=1 Tax=viral metagenome TaxID=1070528 RepID=A0A6H1ZKR8_9ZZZZ
MPTIDQYNPLQASYDKTIRLQDLETPYYRERVTFFVPGTLAVGANQITDFKFNRAVRLEDGYAHVKVAPTTTAITIELNKTGTPLATLITIAAGANSGQVTLSEDANAQFAATDDLDIDINQVGGLEPGTDLNIVLTTRDDIQGS